ncbi:Ribokinase [Toxocara canis]|uniref:Ribokinase n=1 Tax=Toxocara canis TaxID=6265 RepID=A0A0B2V966_TOXCA|nr:Ribokinase [Toxocara canis]
MSHPSSSKLHDDDPQINSNVSTFKIIDFLSESDTDEDEIDMADIVVFGSIVQDLISYANRFPRPGESIRGKSFEAGCGGKGANQAAQIGRLGGKVIMIGRVGNDIFGPLNIENLKRSGVITDFIERSNTAGTATATVTVTDDGTLYIFLIIHFIFLWLFCYRMAGEIISFRQVGNDIFGPLNIENLKRSGVITDFIERSNTAGTATATVTVTDDGENSIVVTLGANLEIPPSRADQLESVISKAKLVLCQYEIDHSTLKRTFEIAKKHNVRTFFNFAPGTMDFDKSLLKLVDILSTNENETEFLTGITVTCVEDAVTAAKSILRFGPSAAIATLGAKGAVVVTKAGTATHIPVPRVKAVDTTGAGDSFCGSLAYLMVARPHLPIEEQVRRASLIASISVQRKGTQVSFPWAHDLPEDFLS